MNNKIFGIKISTILSVLLCFLFAVAFWLFVKYSEFSEIEACAFAPMYLIS